MAAESNHVWYTMPHIGETVNVCIEDDNGTGFITTEVRGRTGKMATTPTMAKPTEKYMQTQWGKTMALHEGDIEFDTQLMNVLMTEEEIHFFSNDRLTIDGDERIHFGRNEFEVINADGEVEIVIEETERIKVEAEELLTFVVTSTQAVLELDKNSNWHSLLEIIRFIGRQFAPQTVLASEGQQAGQDAIEKAEAEAAVQVESKRVVSEQETQKVTEAEPQSERSGINWGRIGRIAGAVALGAVAAVAVVATAGMAGLAIAGAATAVKAAVATKTVIGVQMAVAATGGAALATTSAVVGATALVGVLEDVNNIRQDPDNAAGINLQNFTLAFTSPLMALNGLNVVQNATMGLHKPGKSPMERLGGFVNSIKPKSAPKQKTGPYAHILDGKKVGPGKNFTASQKQKIIEANRKNNEGVVRSDTSGTVLTQPQKSMKGVTPSPNEWQIDHIQPKSKGGSNSFANAQVLSREENRLKSDK